MSDETWTDAEWQSFYQMADAFMAPANALSASAMTDEIAAAMLYSCARFNAFAMQAQDPNGAMLDREAVDFLAEEFESHLLDSMEEQIAPTPGSRDNPVGGPERAVLILRDLDGKNEGDVSEFLDLADRFVAVANQMLDGARIGRVSAAFMHAAARFNVYTMQCLGHPPEQVDQDLVSAFRDIYAALVHYHGQDVLVSDGFDQA